MKKLILILIASAVSLSSIAAETGIKFFHGTYAEALALAKKEKKQIFIDFFTEWCGPCLTMAETVFILPEVGEIYNNNFINLKIDAEKGEGIELAKKFGVRSYPSYIFVNPKTGEMSHRSGGNKPAKDFIADTKGALNSKLSSIYLDATYEKGSYDRNFLVSYIEFKKSSGARELAGNMFDELVNKMGAKLTEPETWRLFTEVVTGYDNPYLMEVSSNYDKYVALYGKKAVDEKLKGLTSYAPLDMFPKLCNFQGKEQNIATIQISKAVMAKEYEKATTLIDAALVNKDFDQQELIRSLSFSVRISPRYDTDEIPFEWIAKKVEYLKYIAYNHENRDDAQIHFNYATGLNYLLERSLKEGKTIPQSIVEIPKIGKAEYDTRPAKLKQKPKRK